MRRPRELASMRPFTLVASALLAVAAQAGKFPDAYSEPPKGYSGPVFRLSQDYPTEMPKPSPKPWERFDPVTQPDEYIRAILAYCLEGNLEVDFAGQNNKVRKWYHVPWLHWGLNGRDYMRGLTFELAAPPGKLADTQKSWATNCAVGMYNAEGGYIIGKVWADPDNPRKGNIKFPNGTCVFKLLFTTAPVEELPFLKNSKEWQGVIASPVGPYDTSVERSQKTVRLLQIDVAVRDDRVKETGWVFGTFVYDGNQPGAGVFERCVPVGLMVGNDPTLTPDQRAKGVLPKESWINPAMQLFAWRSKPGMGWLGRLNGPVDNPASSCMSCHSTAGYPNITSLLPDPSSPISSQMLWFRNIRAGRPFTKAATSMDYSLQLAISLQNFDQWKYSTKTRLFPLGDSLATEQPMVAPIRRFEPKSESEKKGGGLDLTLVSVLSASALAWMLGRRSAGT